MCEVAQRPTTVTIQPIIAQLSLLYLDEQLWAQRPTTVTIQPIIAHLSTGDLAEIGVGGGGDDLKREAELESLDQDTLDTLWKRLVCRLDNT